MVQRSQILHMVEQGRDYEQIAAETGVPAGLAYLLATGIPADGGDTVTGIQRERPGMLPAHSQRLVNPRQVNPTAREDVHEWVRRRARGDAAMQAAARRSRAGGQ